MHKNADRTISLRRKRSIAAHNKTINIASPSFAVSDLVLVRRPNDRGHKLTFRWHGPCRITAVHNPLVYNVTLFAWRKFGTRALCTAILISKLAVWTASAKGFDGFGRKNRISLQNCPKILDVREVPDGLFFRVQWDGQPYQRDWTWQAVEEIYVDTKNIVKDFLATISAKESIVSKIKRQLNTV